LEGVAPTAPGPVPEELSGQVNGLERHLVSLAVKLEHVGDPHLQLIATVVVQHRLPATSMRRGERAEDHGTFPPGADSDAPSYVIPCTNIHPGWL
jgi:hypothetical protein